LSSRSASLIRDLTATEVITRGAAASADVPMPVWLGEPVTGRAAVVVSGLGVRGGELTAAGRLDTVVFGFVVDVLDYA